MAAKFIAEEGSLKGLVLPLEHVGDAGAHKVEPGDKWIIGRDPEECQLVLEDPSVSRKHLLLVQTEDGITLENLSSTNKVFVNDEEVLSPRLLQDSDFVKIGSGVYRFYNESNDAIVVDGMESDEPPQKDELQKDVQPETLKTNTKDLMQEQSETSKQNPEFEEDIEDSIYDEDGLSQSGLASINFDHSEPGRFLLKVISGVNNGAEFSMQADHTYLIGTDHASCDIVFNDNSVSRQHVRLTIDPENKIYIEDLKSRNGTLVDGEAVTSEKKLIDPNALITVGTTSFIIYDKESAMQTVISPLMPSIVKILQQKEEAKRAQEEAKVKAAAEAEEQARLNAFKTPEHIEKNNRNINAFVLISIITGLFTLATLGTVTLFRSEPVISEQSANIDSILSSALSPFPSLKYNFNKSTGVLLLAGHVLTATDKNQLLYNLQGLKFIKNLDDAGVVIDEFATREINPTLNRNPAWRSVSIQTPSPGKFVLTGYLQTRKQSESLWDYVSNNFAYVSLLEKKVVVEEDVISNVNSLLLHDDLKDVTVQMSEGEMTLTGFIPTGKQPVLAKIITDIKEIPGIRGVKSYVAEIAGDLSMVNLTDKYEVTGFSHQGKGNLSVVINKRILIRGDTLDGMLITSIKPNVIFLEKNGVKYRIDYNQ